VRIFVDRENELSSLEALFLDGRNRRRLAIVCADDGMGKTALLDEIYDRHTSRTAIACIDIGRTYDLLSLLNDIADQLAAQGMDLRAYRAMAIKLAGPPHLKAELSNIKAYQSPIDVTINTIIEQRYTADLLLSQLLTDIEITPIPPRHLILIDRYEQAGKPLRDWLGASLLPRILHRSATVCVLAGCDEPSLTYAEQQHVERISLPLLEVQDIRKWLVAAGVPQPEEYVTFLWQGTKGVPGNLQLFIINLVAAEKSKAHG
jgi:hypothetical protein